MYLSFKQSSCHVYRLLLVVLVLKWPHLIFTSGHQIHFMEQTLENKNASQKLWVYCSTLQGFSFREWGWIFFYSENLILNLPWPAILFLQKHEKCHIWFQYCRRKEKSSGYMQDFCGVRVHLTNKTDSPSIICGSFLMLHIQMCTVPQLRYPTYKSQIPL